MRDPERIPKILARLQMVWEKYPDLRLGQLIENVYRNVCHTKDHTVASGPHLKVVVTQSRSAYYMEDEEFIKEIERVYNVCTPEELNQEVLKI